jgi:beclin
MCAVHVQACGVTFTTARLLPMGSHPRIQDKRNMYDLFGPVSKLWSANYDKAMVCFLGCLREFGDHAAAQDRAWAVDQPFTAYPFTIDGDKVGTT